MKIWDIGTEKKQHERVLSIRRNTILSGGKKLRGTAKKRPLSWRCNQRFNFAAARDARLITGKIYAFLGELYDDKLPPSSTH